MPFSGNLPQWVQRATEIIQYENGCVREYEALPVIPLVLNGQTFTELGISLSAQIPSLAPTFL